MYTNHSLVSDCWIEDRRGIISFVTVAGLCPFFQESRRKQPASLEERCIVHGGRPVTYFTRSRTEEEATECGAQQTSL